MLRIRESGEDELPELVEVAQAAQPREDTTASGFLDWREQARELVWLLAERDDATVGAGIALLDALEGWAGDNGASELEGAVAEEHERGLAWAHGRGYSESGRNFRLVLGLTAIEAPDPSPPDGVEIVAWAALKRTQIAWAKGQEYTSLQTATEIRNEPIRRLNERHGYVVEPGVAIVRATISAA